MMVSLVILSFISIGVASMLTNTSQVIKYTEITDGLKSGERIVTSLDRAGVKAGAVVVPEAEAAK